MAPLVVVLLGVQLVQATSLYIPFWGSKEKPKPGLFRLAPTSFTASHFKFHEDITDPPSELRKTWEYTGGFSEALASFVKPDMTFSGYTSIIQSITLSKKQKRVLGIPEDATQFVFSYPVLELKGALTEDNKQKDTPLDPDVGFFSIGGYMYFDADKNFISALTLQSDAQRGSLKFEQRLPWKSKWSEAMPGSLFHHTTFPEFVKEGITFFMWVPPGEMFLTMEDKQLDQKYEEGNIFSKLRAFWQPSPTADQPKCPHGCFVYLGHHPKVRASLVQEELDVYYPLEFNDKIEL